MTEPTVQTGSGLSENAASGLAYITFIPAIIFLAMEPYNQSRNVRFHAWQSIFFAVACTVLWVALIVIGMIPFLNLIDLILTPICGLALLAIWIILLVNALNGKHFKLPVLGDLAEKQANGGGM